MKEDPEGEGGSITGDLEAGLAVPITRKENKVS